MYGTVARLGISMSLANASLVGTSIIVERVFSFSEALVPNKFMRKKAIFKV